MGDGSGEVGVGVGTGKGLGDGSDVEGRDDGSAEGKGDGCVENVGLGEGADEGLAVDLNDGAPVEVGPPVGRSSCACGVQCDHCHTTPGSAVEQPGFATLHQWPSESLSQLVQPCWVVAHP